MNHRKKYNNPKALDLEKLRNIENKVTLGFRCEPDVKITLAENADELGLTLSAYVESSITDNEKIIDAIKDEVYAQNGRMLKVMEQKNKRIAFFENDLLKSIYEKNKGAVVKYLNGRDEIIELTVNDISDTYTIIINSFKINSK